LVNLFYTGKAYKTPDEARGDARAAAAEQQIAEQAKKEAEEQAKKRAAGQTTCPTLKPETTGVGTGPKSGEQAPKLQQDVSDVYGVTADCLYSPGCCWFRVCCDKCIGKHRGCSCKVGGYRGVYVVVERGIGQEMLSRLTMVILDFALYQGVQIKSSAPTPEQRLALLGMRQAAVDQLNQIETRRGELKAGAVQGSEQSRKAEEESHKANQERLKGQIDEIDRLLEIPATTVQPSQMNPYFAPPTIPYLQFRQQLNALAPNLSQ
jgi:hypothetical protein